MDWGFVKKKEFKIFLTIWLIYIFFISGFGGNWLADSMLSESLSIVNDYTFVADNYVKEGCKEIGCDYAFYEGHFYSGFAPGPTLLAVPLLFVFKPVFMLLPESFMGYTNVHLSLILANILATVFISSLLGALLAVLVYWFSKYFTKSKKIRLLTAFTFAFGTLFFVYSTEYASRVMASFFVFLAFYLLFRAKHSSVRNRDLFLAGLFCGLSVFTEYTQAIVVVFVAIYLLTFLRDKRVLYFFLGGFIIFLALISYHQFIFGGPFSTAYGTRMAHYAIDDLAYGVYGTAIPTSESLWGLSFSPEKGLFIYVPVSILSLLGFALVLKNRSHKYFIEMFIVALIVSGFFLYNASLGHWRANCGFGPRYLIVIMPFLMLPMIFALEKIKFRVAVLFAGLSVFINFLPVLYGKTVLWQSFEGMGCNNPNVLFGEYVPLLFQRGLTNYSLNLIKYSVYDISVYLMNLIALGGLVILGLIIWFIWKKN
ncbi:MAG: glycosyltransferase family 39 protein [archaeon]